MMSGEVAGRDDGNERSLFDSDRDDGGRAGHATGVIVLLDGKIAGGDLHFDYTGSYRE